MEEEFFFEVSMKKLTGRLLVLIFFCDLTPEFEIHYIFLKLNGSKLNSSIPKVQMAQKNVHYNQFEKYL